MCFLLLLKLLVPEEVLSANERSETNPQHIKNMDRFKYSGETNFNFWVSVKSLLFRPFRLILDSEKNKNYEWITIIYIKASQLS